MRSSHVNRKTKESEVDVKLNLDGSGQIDIDTGVPFFDHMLSQLGKHAGFDLTVKTKGDVDVDSHHTVEDTSLAFGQALREALGDKAGIRRFGDSMVPLDEVLVQAVLLQELVILVSLKACVVFKVDLYRDELDSLVVRLSYTFNG